MRILIVHRYYWPDKAPCATIISSVARHLASEGHDVDALSSQPSYYKSSTLEHRPKLEIVHGVKLRRLSLPYEAKRPWMRIFNALFLGFSIIIKAFTKKYDLIIVATVPPVLGGFFSTVSAKLTGARMIYYCLDLHPEVGCVSGDFAHPSLFSALKRIDDWTCRHADPVLVHSTDMRRALQARYKGRNYNIQIMNNFAVPQEHYANADMKFSLGSDGYRLTVIYAGNIGRFQGLEIAVDAMALLSKRKDIALFIMGDGVAKHALKKRAQTARANVQFIDYQPTNVVKQAISLADIGLVTLIPNMYKYAYPSKTMAYLEQGKPIIAAVEPESELARNMLTNGYGFSVPVGDPEALASLLVKLANDNDWKPKMGKAASLAFEQDFSPKVILERWTRVVETGSVI